MVIGIGQCCWDYLGVVDGYPAADSKAELLDWEEQGGGPVATALVTLARLGINCRIHGVIGADELGTRIRSSLEYESVQASGLVTRAGAVSQRAFIAVERQTGLRTIFWQRPTGEPLRFEELPENFLEGGRFLLLDGLMAEVSLKAAHEARRQQVPVMLDAGRMRPGMMELAAVSDYVVAGEQFFLDLGWDGSVNHFSDLSSAFGATAVTITRGRQGSLTWQSDEVIQQEALSVATVDTTGAGDVFHGGYLYGLLQGWGLEDVLLFASATAAMKCRHLGGRSGIPSLAAVSAFLQEQKGRGLTL